MQSRYNSNLPGSIQHPSDIPIPHNFVVSEGILQDTEGKNINIPVIFDPAASTNFIHKSLIIDLGWNLESTNYPVIRMNEIESVKYCSVITILEFSYTTVHLIHGQTSISIQIFICQSPFLSV